MTIWLRNGIAEKLCRSAFSACAQEKRRPDIPAAVSACRKSRYERKHKPAFKRKEWKSEVKGRGEKIPPLPFRQLFEIHGSELKPDPIGNLGQASVGSIPHGVLLFGVRKDAFDGFLAPLVQVLRVNPKFCVNSIWGANRAKFIQGGSRGIRLPPCQQHNAGGVGCQGRRSCSACP